MLNFWGPKKYKKVINSSTKCLISIKIAIMTPHIIPLPLVNVWLIFDLQKYVNWLLCILESQSVLSKSTGLLYGSTASCRSIQCCMYCSTLNRLKLVNLILIVGIPHSGAVLNCRSNKCINPNTVKSYKNYLQNTEHMVLRNHPTLSIGTERLACQNNPHGVQLGILV